MTRDASIGHHYDDDMIPGLFSVERIEAEAAAVTDEHITARLHDVLATAFGARLTKLERLQSPYPFPASPPPDVDAADVQDLAVQLQNLKRQLHSVRLAVGEAEAHRDAVLRACADAERRLTSAGRLAAAPSVGDGPLGPTVLDLSQGIIDEARAEADRIVNRARVEAAAIVSVAQNKAASLVGGKPPGQAGPE
ncbi:hypothetical protein ACIA5D_36545 [Actinoplanes sp. NPDC051513]|uniref:hypothetical protein n=1 Tax=Actinoplanes sp. NPDC051513 TaxID=3363908 RepID=UPI00379D1F35